MIAIRTVYRYWFIGIYYFETNPYELSIDSNDDDTLSQIEMDVQTDTKAK